MDRSFEGWLSRSAEKTRALADRLEKKRRQLYKEEMEGCTFKPKIITKRTIGRTPAPRLNGGSTAAETTPLVGGPDAVDSYALMFERARQAAGGQSTRTSSNQVHTANGEMAPGTGVDVQQSDSLQVPNPRKTLEPSPLLSPSTSPHDAPPLKLKPFAAQSDGVTPITSTATLSKGDGRTSAFPAAVNYQDTGLVEIGELLRCAWEGVLSHENGMPRPPPRLTERMREVDSGLSIDKEVIFLQDKITSTLEPDRSSEDEMVRNQSLSRPLLLKYLADNASSIDWQDIRAIQTQRQRDIEEAQREQISNIRKKRDSVYRRLLSFYRKRMIHEGFKVARGEPDVEEISGSELDN